jgi:hypothetical protein
MYRVFGYNDMCEDFDHTFDSLFRAALFYVRRQRIGMYVQFVDGFTSAQEEKLERIR